jgi:hypothetical protein
LEERPRQARERAQPTQEVLGSEAVVTGETPSGQGVLEEQEGPEECRLHPLLPPGGAPFLSRPYRPRKRRVREVL